MAVRPTLADLNVLDDPFEREYVEARRGTIPDDELIENLTQYRHLRAADAADAGETDEAPAAPASSPAAPAASCP